MKRKRAKPNRNSTQTARTKQTFDATRSIRELQQRLSMLELRFTEVFGPDLDELSAQFAASERKRPGPEPVSKYTLFSNRDQLVQMLEANWPELEPYCHPVPNARGIRSVLASIAAQEALPHQGRHSWAAEHLSKSLPLLTKFLAGDRFRRDPRQIANAFAGIPQVSTWRSLKVCQEKPCNDHIGPRAIKAYILRKHPNLYERLAANYSIVNFVTALRAQRSKDKALRSFHPKYPFSCWKDCEPRRLSSD